MAPEISSERRRRQVAGIAGASLLVSLIGGILVLLLNAGADTARTAIKKIQPPTTTVTVTPSAAPDGTDLSMFGLGEGAMGVGDSTDAGTPGALAGSTGLGSAAAPAAMNSLPGQLPDGSLPPAPDASLDPVDFDPLLNSIVTAQQNVQAAGVAGSVIGTAGGITSAAITSTAVVLGDLILYAAFTNSGPGLLNALQTSLGTAPAAAAVAAGVPQALPAADFSGLSTAFAAAAAAPPVGVPALPALPPLPQLPPLPPPPNLDGLAAGISALPAIGAIPGFALPELPPPPQLPRPEDVVGGIGGAIVGATIAGAVLGAILPPPPSITRMMGLPF